MSKRNEDEQKTLSSDNHPTPPGTGDLQQAGLTDDERVQREDEDISGGRVKPGPADLDRVSKTGM